MSPVVVWTIRALRVAVAAVLAVASIGKFTGDPAAVVTFDLLGLGVAGRYLIGVLEAVVALGLLVPATAPTAAVLGWGVMTGALIAHATHLGFTGDAAPLALAAALTWTGCLALLVLYRERVPLLGVVFGYRDAEAP